MKDSPELRAAIRATSAFRELSDDNLAILIEAAELETFASDATLMVQGEASDYAMLILEGAVTVSADSARGAIPISTLHAPSLVGELGALAQLPRSATARACTPVTALRFGRAALVEVAHATPSLLIDVIGRMGDRMRKFNGAISLYTHALGGLERHQFDPALLEELRNPNPRPHRFRADFSDAWPNRSSCVAQRDDEMASAAVIQRALLPRVKEFADESSLDVLGGDDAGARRRRRLSLISCRLPTGAWRLGVGDVCGKGVPAALFMGITKTLIPHKFARKPQSPSRDRQGERVFWPTTTPASCSRRRYTPPTTRARARSIIATVAISPATFVALAGAVETLPVGGLPVGLFDPMKMMVAQAHLRPGDLFFLYTDGVTEAEDP